MPSTVPYNLGLDLGPASIGWACIGLTDSENGEPSSIIAAGVRKFDAGVDGSPEEIERGKDKPRAAARREARHPRRQNWRTQNRKKKLFNLLQELELLPSTESGKSSQRKVCLETLDAALRQKFLQQFDHDAHQKLTYLLRSKAIEEPLEPYEVGRAIYALAQRRGYLSNRKSLDEKDGKVKQQISLLRENMEDFDEDATISKFFVEKVTPSDASEGRIRGRYTHRDMFKDEFFRIRDTQSTHLQLSTDDWKKIKHVIFFQRPLKSQKNLIGKCEIHPDQRRCLKSLPAFQEFRILQQVNNLYVLVNQTEKISFTDPSLYEARHQLIAALFEVKSMTLKSARKKAGLPPSMKFSGEDDKNAAALKGNITEREMITACGDRWFEFSLKDQRDIVHEVSHYKKPKALKRRAIEAWGLSGEQAEVLKHISLEEGHASHSEKALKELVELMREGMDYTNARLQLEKNAANNRPTECYERLPPVLDWNSDIASPTMIRALTELRKVVNCIITKYGKPVKIHIELGRDIKRSREHRQNTEKYIKRNEARRRKATERLLENLREEFPNHPEPHKRDIDKWMLAEECNCECPYCGKRFGGIDVVGRHSEFNVEHIYPRRYMDDSFDNKVISCRECNVLKEDRTPMQAFSGSDYDKIIQRVKRFRGPRAAEKLNRFRTKVPPKGFANRHLNDMRYNARLATKYVSLLFQEHWDEDDEPQKKRVLTPTGQLTAKVRHHWGMNQILSNEDIKNRDDHRHHAVDAIVIGIVDDRYIHNAAIESAEQAEVHHKRSFFEDLQPPWEGFIHQVQQIIDKIKVSHRATRSRDGSLHKETNYSPELIHNGESFRCVRKELWNLTKKQIEGNPNSDDYPIIDPAVRKAIQKKFEELGGNDPSKIFDKEENLPTLPNRKGGPPTPIRKVRVKVSIKPTKVGEGVNQRYVESGSNFASLVYATLDKGGNEKKWNHEVITRLEAAKFFSDSTSSSPGKNSGHEKILIPEKILNFKDENAECRYKFSLKMNDMLLLEGEDGTDTLYRVQSLSESEIQLCPHNVPTIRDYMDKKTGKKVKLRSKWNRITSIDNLRKRNARPVEISPIGEISIKSDSGRNE